MKFLTVFIVAFFWNCSKPKGPLVVPGSLFFVIKVNNVLLDSNTLNSMRLYYYQSGIKNYINDFQRGSEEGYALGVQTTRNIGFLSGDDNIKDYFIEFPTGDIDTLYVDYKSLKEKQALNNPCFCYYPLEVVKYNGVSALPDVSITRQKVYRFNKL